MVTNRRLVPDAGPDYYRTPEWGPQALLDHENFIGRIWEPCCGGTTAYAWFIWDRRLSVKTTELKWIPPR